MFDPCAEFIAVEIPQGQPAQEGSAQDDRRRDAEG
jgi:hypothetical protein